MDPSSLTPDVVLLHCLEHPPRVLISTLRSKDGRDCPSSKSSKGPAQIVLEFCWCPAWTEPVWRTCTLHGLHRALKPDWEQIPS